MVSGIYKIECLGNKQVYVGLSCNINNRWSAHKSAARKNYHHSVYFQNSWNKYGEESFVFSILEECSQKQLSDREIFWWKTLKPKFNSANPGANPTHTEEIREKISKALSKEFTLYHPDRGIIEGWSLDKFARENNLDGGHLTKVIQGKRRQYKQYFRSEEDYKTPEQLEIQRGKNISQGKRKIWTAYDPNNEEISFVGLEEFCNENDLCKTVFERVLSGRDPKTYFQHKGYSREKKPELISPEGQRYVIYNGILKQISEEYDLDVSGLSKVIKGKNKQCKGWTLAS
jgi:group I intron endonuclease